MLELLVRDVHHTAKVVPKPHFVKISFSTVSAATQWHEITHGGDQSAV
jgi:hypothetical protein